MEFEFTRRLGPNLEADFIREPIVAVDLIGSTGEVEKTHALIDSGANDCVFNMRHARSLGINLHECQIKNTVGIEGKPMSVYFTELEIEILGLGKMFLPVGFKENLPIGGLLGQVSFFDQFNVHFKRTENIFEITEAKKVVWNGK